MKVVAVFCVLIVALLCGVWGRKKPHVLFIMADDLGWGDVGWSELADIPTPNLLKLRSESLELMQFYTQPKCTAARAALMTGRYPFKMGLQTNDVFTRFLNSSLDLKYKLLPEYFKDMGYHTHMVGKWHLGHCNEKYTPIKRGFDTCFGPWANVEDRFHLIANKRYDWNWNNEPYLQANGTFTTHLVTNHTQHMLKKHFGNATTKNEQIFLYAAYLVPHKPSEAPEHYITTTACSLIPETIEVEVKGVRFNTTNLRRPYCGMVAALDEGIGNITDTLRDLGVIDDFIIIVTSDNGAGVNAGARSWPLRGSKQTVYEGGTRVRTLLRARFPFVNIGNETGEYHGLVHMVDMLPSLVDAARGNLSVIPADIDGRTAWKSIRKGHPTYRNVMVYNIDSERKLGAIRLKNATHNFKLVYSNKTYQEVGYRPGDPRPMCEQVDDPTKTYYPRKGQHYFFFDLDDNPNERPGRNAHLNNGPVYEMMKRKLRWLTNNFEVPVIKYGRISAKNHTQGGIWHVGGC